MRTHPAWFGSVGFQPPTFCMGLRLLPYRLGHEFLLWKYQSKFLTNETVGLGDLLAACLICTQTFEAAERLLNSPFLLQVFCKVWAWRAGKSVDFIGEVEDFRKYRATACWFPEPILPDKLRDLASPWPHRLLVRLMSDLHLPQSEALNTPMNFATAIYCAYAETEKDLELLTSRREQVLDRVNEINRKLEQEGLAV